MLTSVTEAPDFFTRLIPYSEYRPFPLYGERRRWEALSEKTCLGLITRAEEASAEPFPLLTLTDFLRYVREGDRQGYEQQYFARRAKLQHMVLGECCEGKGRFLDAIANAVWAICEETTWVVPAHNIRGGCRPDKQRPVPVAGAFPFIDLFAAATGALLAMTHYFLGEALNKVTPCVPERIQHELRRRIFEPFMAEDRMWWMGMTRERRLNNWTAWCSANIMFTYLFMDIPDEERAAGVRRAAACAERFYNDYAPDGGCEEGPVYFGLAGGAYINALEMLDSAIYGHTGLLEDEKALNMAEYIYHMHIAGEWFVNFSDAAPRMNDIAVGSLLHLSSPALKEFARYACREGLRFDLSRQEEYGRIVWRNLREVFIPADGRTAIATPASRFHYYPGIETMVARQQEHSFGGFLLAAKGGTNATAHNHNDVGSYMIYLDGQPVVVDAGCGVYDRKTFSSERYSLWQMQSGYHNTAIINGVDQPNGGQFRARSVSCQDDGVLTTMTMDIADAYPASARALRYQRTLQLNRAARQITIHDEVELEQAGQVTLPLLLAEEPVAGEDGVRIGNTLLHFNDSLTVQAVEPIPLTDKQMRASWQRERLYRLLLTTREDAPRFTLELTYTRAQEV